MPKRKINALQWFFALGKPWYKKWWIWLLILIVLAGLVLIPFLINYSYMKGLKLKEPNTAFTAGEMLALYGSILSFAGTVILGAVALYQNKMANQTNDKLLELEWKREQPCFDVVEAQTYKLYLGEEIIKYKNSNDLNKNLHIKPLFISSPRSGIHTSVALMEIELTNSGNTDIRYIYLTSMEFFISTEQPVEQQRPMGFMGNQLLKKGDTRKLVIEFQQELDATSDKELDEQTSWIYNGSYLFMPHMEFKLHLVTTDGIDYDEEIKLDSDIPQVGAGLILDRTLHVVDINVSRRKENNKS